MRFLFVLFFLCLFSCGTSDDVDCSLATVGLPPLSFIFMNFENNQGEQLLESTYLQDSFKVYNAQVEFYIKRQFEGSDDGLLFDLFSIDQSDTFYLELDQHDIDTLFIGYTQNVGPCFTWRNLDQLIYNEEELYNSNNSTPQIHFTIIKE